MHTCTPRYMYDGVELCRNALVIRIVKSSMIGSSVGSRQGLIKSNVPAASL